MGFLPALKSIDRRRALLILGVCLLPFLVNLLLPQIFFQRSIPDFFPNTWNDQVSYGRQIATMNAVGWEGGYYTVNEQPASAAFSRFYAHGPTFPWLYGSLSRLTGWTYATGLWFNLIFLSAGLAFFIIAARLDTKQCLYLAALYITSWVLHLYTVSLMQEAFHHAAALVFAGIFFHLLRYKPHLSPPTIVLIIAFTLAMGLIRLSWMLLCVPLFLALIPRWRVTWVLGALIAAGVLIGGIYLMANWISAPGANSITTVVTTMQSDIGAGLALLMEQISGNISQTLEKTGFNLQGFQLFQMLILMGVSIYRLTQYARTRHETETPITYWAFVIYALISIIVLSLTLYLSNGFLRIFALPLFVCTCLLIAFREYRLLLVIIALNAFGGAAFRSEYAVHQANFEFAAGTIQEWQAEARSALIYQENAPSPWCNTILMDLPLYDYHAALLPPEFGTTWFNEFPEPMKSRYYYARERTRMRFLKEKETFSFGGFLYENTDVQALCQDS